jgi:hypothetical protein
MAVFSASYSDFRTAVATWIDWTGSTTTQLNDLIKVGEQTVYKRLRVRQMETALAATVGSDGTCTVPTDYVEMKHARFNTSPVRTLKRKNAEWIYENYPDRSVTGEEQYFARDGSSFIFGSTGAAGRVMTGSYYARPSSMADNSTINSVFSAHPEVFLFGTLAEDARMPVWKMKFEELLVAANNEDKSEGQSGSRLFATLA